MDGNQTLNLNSGCIKSIDQWGETIHYNICNGTSVAVPWGLVHYVAFPLMLIFMLVVIAGMIKAYRGLR
jgi:hypothetical protein